MKDYIFGYGSLVNKVSREITGKSTLVGPVRVQGLQRRWNVHTKTATALGIVKRKGSQCNGVIISVSPEVLDKFDERETPTSYERISIPIKDIDFIDGKKPKNGNFWVYVARMPMAPDQEHPILQSYVDVVLTGFLEFGTDFAKEFLDTTMGLENILNDRGNPIYSRAMKEVEKMEEIDKLLAEDKI